MTFSCQNMTNVRNLKKSTLLQLYARAIAPCRDYYGLTIGEQCICLNIWKVTHGPHVFPKQIFLEVEDFIDDRFLQEEIKNVFGDNVYQYIVDLVHHRTKLHHLPPKVFLNILKYLNTNDVLRMSLTSKIFLELCNSDLVWQLLFTKVLQRSPSKEEKRLAMDCGWKEVLKKRMTYIRKVFVENRAKKTVAVVQRPKQPVTIKKKCGKAK
ncbi:unnamed protein product [Phaedon cochleariae]|uniref:F-box domain-containing protein n=1 Tax=Phaedon cochleariae TaxID=80249 RepID=A0A9P0DIS5_PHACE|nr:unnamed protein product [Phaedon cochleariae]